MVDLQDCKNDLVVKIQQEILIQFFTVMRNLFNSETNLNRVQYFSFCLENVPQFLNIFISFFELNT